MFLRFTKGYFEKDQNGIPKPIARGKNSYFTYVGQEVDPEQVEELSEPFRGYSFYHKYSEKQLQSLKKLLQNLASKHNIDIREGLPNLIRKKGVKAFDMVGTKMCLNTPGLWSHANVNSSKNDISPHEESVEMLLGI